MTKKCNNCGFQQNEFLKIVGKNYCKNCNSEISNRNIQQQTQITLSAYEVEATYEFLYSSLEWLELYIERAHPDWQQKKQLPKTITRSDVPSLNAEEMRGHFRTSLMGMRSITFNKPQFLLEELQTEFFSWFDNSGINVNNCSDKLKQELIDFHSILIGKGGDFAKRRRKETDKEIAKMTREERKESFYGIVKAYQEPLENEDKVFESMKGQTYKDVNRESRFSGDTDQGKEVFEQIKGRRESSLVESLVQPIDPQQLTNDQVIQEFKNNRQDWRIDEVITEYDNLGEPTKKEQALIHKSAEIGLSGEVYGSQPVYPVQRFNQEELRKINEILNSSQSLHSQTQTSTDSHRGGKGGGSGGLGGYGSSIIYGSLGVISLIGLAFVK